MPRKIRHYVRKRGRAYSASVHFYDDDGKRHTKSAGSGYRTEQEAYDAGARLAAEIAGDLNVLGDNVTFEEYAQLWLDSFHFESENTEQAYRYRVLQTLPYIGATPVRELTSRQIQHMINEFRANYAPQTITFAVEMTQRILDFAVHERLLASNPARAPIIQKPSVRQTEKIRFLSNTELARVFAALEPLSNGRYLTLARFLLTTQLRIGEALGMTWDRVDLSGGVIHVTHQLNQRSELIRLKTPWSVRDITIDPATVALLRAHRMVQQRELNIAPQRDMRNFVFTARRGSPITLRTPWVTFNRVGKRIGIFGLRPHLFRHTGASMLIRAGVPIPIVSQRLGHANPAITMSIYAHALPTDDHIASEAMSQILLDLAI